MMLSLYRWATTLGGPAIRFYLDRRMARGKEDPERFGERLGRPGRPRPAGPVIWVHGASVGEAISVLPLIERVRALRPEATVLLTTGTVTSARLMAKRLPEGAMHQFVPVDRAAYVRSFLDHWRPDLALWAESEFWPNLIGETAKRNIPIVLINGRVSDRSFARWGRHRKTIGQILGGFRLCLGQSQLDAERLADLGAPAVASPGNLKLAAPPLPADAATLADLQAQVAGRPVWVAASTHAGEEVLCGRVHRQLAPSHPGLLTVIVPRHPDRGPGIAAELAADGLGVARRSAGGAITAATEVYVADTIGELGLFYRLAGVAFIGKSLVPLGGQNPLEAACLDCAVLFGPHMGNFREIAARLKESGGAEEVADEAALVAVLGRLLTDDEARHAQGAAASAFAKAEARVLERIVGELAPFLEGLEDRHARA
ncbi:MAG: 3-deoxy-D-manno-octulosonic acid transferase [Rhodospirillales bacterium]|nr:3-deoxy-D-manno-octulosonic acid transferase [Rhodospirillales bacterium]